MKTFTTLTATLLISTTSALAAPIENVTVETQEFFGLPAQVEMKLPSVGSEAETWFDRKDHEFTESCTYKEGVEPICHKGVAVEGRRINIFRATDQLLEVKVGRVSFSGFSTFPANDGGQEIRIPNLQIETQSWTMLVPSQH